MIKKFEIFNESNDDSFSYTEEIVKLFSELEKIGWAMTSDITEDDIIECYNDGELERYSYMLIIDFERSHSLTEEIKIDGDRHESINVESAGDEISKLFKELNIIKKKLDKDAFVVIYTSENPLEHFRATILMLSA